MAAKSNINFYDSKIILNDETNYPQFGNEG